VLGTKVWRRLLGIDERTVIERVEFDDEADAVVGACAVAVRSIVATHAPYGAGHRLGIVRREQCPLPRQQ
jgi:hypothetical protein